MAAQTTRMPRFIRRTTLSSGERNTNFVMLDNDIVAAVSSAEADRVTPLMSKIYLRLKTAPAELWERPSVLRFEGETREEKWVKAWDQLCKHLRVSSETANKALRWMHEQGIIGYSAFKNGVGIRIFLNRAASSISTQAGSGGKKILPFAPASGGERAASVSEAAFNDPFGDQESLDTDFKSGAPKNGANTKTVDKKVSDRMASPDRTQKIDAQSHAPNQGKGRGIEATAQQPGTVSVDELVARLKTELEPCVKSAATHAAAQTAAREIARTREWFETKALPKAVRVAQHETYDLLRKHGSLDERTRRARADLEVGRAAVDIYTPPVAHKLTAEEIGETAETCLALLETQGKSIEVTLSEISSEGGGSLLPEDAPLVRDAAQALLRERSERG